MKKVLLQLLFWGISSVFLFSQTSNAIDSFVMSTGLEHALVGICVRDMDGRILYGYNENKLLAPGSTMKIVTTATALELLGSDFRYKTPLSFADSDTATLVVSGVGDPTLGSEYASEEAHFFMDKWVEEVKNQRESQSVIRLLVDDSLFGYDGVSAQWMWEDMGNYYAAGAYGISVFDDFYRLTFNSMNADSTPVIVRVEPNIPGLHFNNELKTNFSNEDNSYIHGAPFANERYITGDIPAGRSNFTIKGDIPDPGMFLAKTFADNLRFDSIKVDSYTTTRLSGTSPENLKTFYVHQSPELKDMVSEINHRSNNQYTEQLIRTLGIEKGQNGHLNALKRGIQAVNMFWRSKGLDTSALLMYDGCGLSPEDGVTPSFMTSILVEMQKGKNDKIFMKSLPQAGVDGTVRSFLKGSSLVGRVWVKSGSIAGVQCFAGYYLGGDKKKYSFSIMVNKFTGSRHIVVKNMENLLECLFSATK